MGRDFPPVQTAPGAHPASCTVGTGSFPGVKCVRGVLLTTHPLLVPLSWKSRAINLPTLWATTGPVTGKLYRLLRKVFGHNAWLYSHTKQMPLLSADTTRTRIKKKKRKIFLCVEKQTGIKRGLKRIITSIC